MPLKGIIKKFAELIYLFFAEMKYFSLEMKYQFEEMKSTQFFSGYIHNEVFYKVLYISLKFYNAYECQSQDIPNFLSHRIDRLVSINLPKQPYALLTLFASHYYE
jgi:hypothetical protein